MFIDRYIITKFQSTYNWIWNHFGITKGILMVVCGSIILVKPVLEIMKEFNFWDALGVIVFLSVVSYSIRLHEFQNNGKFDYINKRALEAKDSMFNIGLRLTFLIIFIGVLPLRLYLFDINFVLRSLYFGLPFIILLYLETVMIYNREQPVSKEVWNGI